MMRTLGLTPFLCSEAEAVEVVVAFSASGCSVDESPTPLCACAAITVVMCCREGGVGFFYRPSQSSAEVARAYMLAWSRGVKKSGRRDGARQVPSLVLKPLETDFVMDYAGHGYLHYQAVSELTRIITRRAKDVHHRYERLLSEECVACSSSPVEDQRCSKYTAFKLYM